MNHGQPELNSSSIGMVVAALQAINGINLFGARGGPASVIHVLPDEIIRNYTTVYSTLPRESGSKEVDAALLSVISFPAFAIHDIEKVNKTIVKKLGGKYGFKIVKKLGGKYGFKRFLRDGHQTVLEDTTRLHYNPQELTIFEHVESEWPLFFTYMILDGLFRGDREQVRHYQSRLNPLMVEENGIRLIPELYIVPKEKVEGEKRDPGSQIRTPNENVPLVWAQSLHILGNLLDDDLLSLAEIDPLGRRLFQNRSISDVVVQVVLLSDSPQLQSKLRMYGLETQTLEECEPVTICHPSALRDALQTLGENRKLGLSGRPQRPVGTLSTCKVYRCQGRLYSFLPHFTDREEFYLVSDNDYLITVFEEELKFVRDNWFFNGRPTLSIMLTTRMLGSLKASNGKRNLFNFMSSLRTGNCNGVRIRLGRLSEVINTACIENLDFLEERPESFAGLKGISAEKLNFKIEKRFLGRKSSIRRYPSFSDVQDVSPLALPLLDDKTRSSVSSVESPLEISPMKLILGDTSSLEEAYTLLKKSSNMFDQIDLLEYIHSCHGLNYLIPDLGTVGNLLEEVYTNATQYCEWSIVRQAAGILKKVVNNLSINVSDLLVRQKPLLLGFGSKTFFLTTPMRPQALADLIFSLSTDTREGPLVQEIIVYLSSFAKSDLSMLDGILRIQTHFFIIAMREEISRSRGCNEEQAVEHLMNLSPFEMKSLLGTVIGHKEAIQTPKNNKSLLSVSCQSAGYKVGNFATIKISVDGQEQNTRLILGRGINMVVVHAHTGDILETASFDTHSSVDESNELAKVIQNIEPGSIVVLACKDEAAENLTEEAKVAIECLGSDKIKNLNYRDSWCMIGIKGSAPGTVMESLSSDKTETLFQEFNLQGTLDKTLYSYGRYLRKRKNDGALNRVPPKFYPKVWKLLSKSHGIMVDKTFLPRDPTISEKTPGELNFALQVESIFDTISDPAERQIAVECIVIIHRLDERNPEIRLKKGTIDLLAIIQEAVKLFWSRHVEKTGSNHVVSGCEHKVDTPILKRPNRLATVPDRANSPFTEFDLSMNLTIGDDSSFEKNEKLAKRLFFDVPPEGPDGTMSFLATACVHQLFEVVWEGE